MKVVETAFQISAVLCGFYAAFLWWQSSDTVKVVNEMPTTGGTGDTAIKLNDGKIIVYSNAKQASLNKSAAAWTAASVGLQALAIVVRLI